MTPMSGWSARRRRVAGAARDLAAEPVAAQRRHQVTDIEPAPAPTVTEYVAQAKQCPGCGTVTEGELPAHVRARASFGPETCAQAANLTGGHHIPIWRCTLLLCQLAGIAVSTEWMAATHRHIVRSGIREEPPEMPAGCGRTCASRIPRAVVNCGRRPQ
jgi:transposase